MNRSIEEAISDRKALRSLVGNILFSSAFSTSLEKYFGNGNGSGRGIASSSVLTISLFFPFIEYNIHVSYYAQFSVLSIPVALYPHVLASFTIFSCVCY